MPLLGVNPFGGQIGLGEGATEIFLRGLGLGFAVTTGFALAEGVIVGLAVAFTVGVGVALTVGVGVALLVAATAELPERAIAIARMIESFFIRAPT